MHKVFVYGTLLSGYGNNRLLASSELLGKDTVKGSLWAVSSFPGFHTTGDNDIHGEVWLVDNHTLEQLDRLEGFYADGDYRNMYNRVKISPRNEMESVWIYEWNMNIAEMLNYKYEEIETGNYRDYTSGRY